MTWDETIATLEAWREDSSGFVDIVAPSRIAIGNAIGFAASLRNMSYPEMKAVAPNGDGGIVFRWGGLWGVGTTRAVEFFSDGEIRWSA